MSDQKHDDADKKDDKKAAAAAGAPAKGGVKALLGPLAAVVVLVSAGVGIGMFTAKFFAKAPAAAAGAHGAEHVDAAGEGEHAGGAHESLLHSAKEMVIEDVVANVKDQGGKRFVKIVPAFWVTTDAATAIGLAGGGHGGGEVGGEIKRIIKARIEEHLKKYDLEELTSPSIYKPLEKNLKDIAEKEIKAFAPELPSTKPVVLKVICGGLVVQ